jgi:hypothetical protein
MDGFLVFSRLGLEGLYDDNIFRTESNKVDDFIWIVSPEVAARSNWKRHALNFSAAADLGRYSDNTDEDYDDWEIAVDGRCDVGAGAAVLAGGGVAQRHLDRGEPDAPGRAAEPTVLLVPKAFVRYVHGPSKISLSAEGNYTRFDFDDVARIGGGKIDQQFRNRNDFGLEINSGFEFAPRRRALLQFNGSRREYDNDQELAPDVFAERSSWGYQVLAGFDFDFSGIFFGEFLLGYQQRIYDDQIFPNISAPAVAGSIDWNITSLTTISVTLDQSIQETTARFFSGYVQTRGVVTVDHEMLRNFILRIGGSVEKQDYEGIENAERDIDFYRAGIGIQYLMNRYLYIKAGYNYIKKEENSNLITSGGAERDFENNQVFIGLECHL